MKAFSIFATVLFGTVVAAPSISDEPREQESHEQFRREVTELRELVADLSKKIEDFEYGGLPRMEDCLVPRAVPKMFSDMFSD